MTPYKLLEPYWTRGISGTTDTVKVLVLSAGGAAGLNFVKSLQQTSCFGKPYEVIAADMNEWNLRLAKSMWRYVSPPCREYDRYIDFINYICSTHGIDFIHAQADMEVQALSDCQMSLHTNAKLFLPRNGTIMKCRDKMHTNMWLEKAGVPVPKAQRVDMLRLSLQFEELRHKSKAKKVWLRATQGAGSKAALPVTTTMQADDWMRYWKETKRLENEHFMLSEFLPGVEYAWQSLWKNGELLVSATRKRLEYYMGNLFPSGQSSSPSVAVTVHNDHVNYIATKAVRAIDEKASGIFCVDLKESEEGVPCVTEINAGRFFTTSDFFTALGCNMPDMYVKLGLGFDLRGEKGVYQYNAVPENRYWIRQPDTEPLLVNGEELQ